MQLEDAPIAHTTDGEIAKSPKVRGTLLSKLKQFRDRLKTSIARPLVHQNQTNPDYHAAIRRLGEDRINQDGSRKLFVRREAMPSPINAAAIGQPRWAPTGIGKEAPSSYADPPPPYSERPPLPSDWRSKIQKAKADQAFKNILDEQNSHLDEGREKLGLKTAKRHAPHELKETDFSPPSLPSNRPKSSGRSHSPTLGSSEAIANKGYAETAKVETATAVKFMRAPAVRTVDNPAPRSGSGLSRAVRSAAPSLPDTPAEPRESLAELHEREQMPRLYDQRSHVHSR